MKTFVFSKSEHFNLLTLQYCVQNENLCTELMDFAKETSFIMLPNRNIDEKVQDACAVDLSGKS